MLPLLSGLPSSRPRLPYGSSLHLPGGRKSHVRDYSRIHGRIKARCMLVRLAQFRLCAWACAWVLAGTGQNPRRIASARTRSRINSLIRRSSCSNIRSRAWRSAGDTRKRTKSSLLLIDSPMTRFYEKTALSPLVRGMGGKLHLDADTHHVEAYTAHSRRPEGQTAKDKAKRPGPAFQSSTDTSVSRVYHNSVSWSSSLPHKSSLCSLCRPQSRAPRVGHV